MVTFLLIFALLCFAGFAIVFYVTGQLAAPQPRTLDAPPAELNAESLLIPQPDGPDIAAWFVASDTKNAKGSVLLLHGIGSSRQEMLGRVPFLRDAGYAVLLIDLQGHGETNGSHITFGHQESRNVHHAVAYLRIRLPDQAVGIIGFSLGGAATLLGRKPIAADALVLEAVFSSITQAVENRLSRRLGRIGKWVSPLLLWQLPPRLGVSASALSPLNAIKYLHSPVLIIGGEDDQRTLPSETKDLFTQANEPKSLWMLAGAKHANFHEFNPIEYEQRILSFLAQHMHPTVLHSK